LQTDASGAEDTTSYTHNQAGDVTSIQDAEDAGTSSATTDLQLLRLQRHAGADDCLDRQRPPGPGTDQPNPGGIGGCTNLTPTRRTPTAMPITYWVASF
jgi:hypothetical protein